MAIELTYGEVESALAEINRVADDKRIAFRARLKHFQRLGFPKGVNTGTGKRVIYTVPMLLQMAVAWELVEFGRTPAVIISQMERTERYISEAFKCASDGEDIIQLFYTREFVSDHIPNVENRSRRSETMDVDFHPSAGVAIASRILRMSEIETLVDSRGFIREFTRSGIINISKVYSLVSSFLVRQDLASIGEVKADIAEWYAPFHVDPSVLRERKERISKMMAARKGD